VELGRGGGERAKGVLKIVTSPRIVFVHFIKWRSIRSRFNALSLESDTGKSLFANLIQLTFPKVNSPRIIINIKISPRRNVTSVSRQHLSVYQ